MLLCWLSVSVSPVARLCTALKDQTSPRGITSPGDHVPSRDHVPSGITSSQGITSLGDHVPSRDHVPSGITSPLGITLIGGIFEDPEAVLKSRHLSDIGPAPPSDADITDACPPWPLWLPWQWCWCDRRVCSDCHDCRDSLSWHEQLCPITWLRHSFIVTCHEIITSHSSDHFLLPCWIEPTLIQLVSHYYWMPNVFILLHAPRGSRSSSDRVPSGSFLEGTATVHWSRPRGCRSMKLIPSHSVSPAARALCQLESWSPPLLVDK